jgi:hypothetical protein
MEYIQFSIENTVKPALYNKSLYIKRRLISPINECNNICSRRAYMIHHIHSLQNVDLETGVHKCSWYPTNILYNPLFKYLYIYVIMYEF